MVKQTPKVIVKGISLSASTLIALFGANSAFAAESLNANFQVNVKETLSVSITRPSAGATGGINDFLRNDFAIDVVSNNAEGFTASMYADVTGNTVPLTNTSLSSATLPTLTDAAGIARSSFPANYWGYTLGQYTLDGTTQTSYTLSGKTYSETAAGNDSSKYYPMVNTSSTPIVIMDGATSPKSTGTQNIYFGAKGDVSTASGTYAGTVIISVVSGGINNTDNPITPTNPDTPSTDPTPNDNNATYTGDTGTGATMGVGSSGTTGTTVYTTTSGNTTTTEISGGDNRSAYADPHGERYDTFSNLSDESTPVTGLVMASSVAAFTGFTFFIFAYRDDDDDEDDEQLANS